MLGDACGSGLRLRRDPNHNDPLNLARATHRWRQTTRPTATAIPTVLGRFDLLRQDLRYARRSLLRQPLFTIVAIATVRRQVVVEGMRLAIAGVAIGLVVALGASGLIGAMLYDVEPTDPLTFAGVLVLTLVVAAAACYLPARRASRLDPLAALRSD